MEKLNEYLQTLLSTCSYELHLEPNKIPYLTSDNGTTEVTKTPLLGTQISMLVFPLIPHTVKQQLPNKTEVEFVHNHNLGDFSFYIKKSAAGFVVTIRPMLSSSPKTGETGNSSDICDDSSLNQTNNLPVSNFVKVNYKSLPTLVLAGEKQLFTENDLPSTGSKIFYRRSFRSGSI